MMTYAEAKNLNGRYQDALRRLSRMRKPALAALLARQDAADRRTRLIGGPRTKDEFLRELLDLDFPVAGLNEATHVLYHAPSARWEACEHCQARPETQTVNTGELRPGDVVLTHGMRVRIDDVREYATGPGERAWTCQGTVLNVADVIAQRIIPPSFLETYGYSDEFHVIRRDAWTVQGNTRAHWIVELPRPSGQEWNAPGGVQYDGQARP